MAGSISPKPSFHLCPDFHIAPPPNGHLKLGSVLQNLKIEGVLNPLDNGAAATVPDSKLYPRDKPSEKAGFCRTMKQLRGIEGSIWAKIFGWDGLGAMFSFMRKRQNDETLTVDKLFVRYYTPTPEDVDDALAIASVAYYISEHDDEEPVYLITGLMWVESARLSKVQSKKHKVGGQLAATDPHTGTSAGAGGNVDSEDSMASSFDGSTPFILGIRVRKIWWDKDGTRHAAEDVVGSTLANHKRGTEESQHDGSKSVDDEQTGQIIADESEGGEESPVVWVWA